MARRRKSKRTRWFLPTFLAYAAVALATGLLLRDRLAEADVALLLFGLLPIVLAAWCADAIRQGEILRQGLNTPAYSTFNTRRITRTRQPVAFWLAVGATATLAIAIAVVVIVGLYLRWHMA